MKQKIFKNTTLLVILAILLTFLAVTDVMYHQIKDCKEQELKNEAEYLKVLLDQEDVETLDSKLKSLDSRITIIDTDGTVLYDSKEDVSTLENHLERPEVQEALQSGEGHSVRYSSTLAKESYYYACQLDNGTILRVANTMNSIFTIMYSCIAVLMLVILIIGVVSVYLIGWQTNKMLEPLNTLDLEHPLDTLTYDELSPLLRRIDQQNGQLSFQMAQLKKQHEEYLAITENMKDGLIVTSRFVVLAINKAAQEVFHTTAEECIGQDIIVVNRNLELKEVLNEALKGKRAEKRILFGEHAYQILGNPVYVDQKIIGGVIFLFDITEKEKTEIIRQEFSANVSHELKTPLMSISGYAEILKNGMVKPEHITEFSTRIYEEAKRLTTLVEDIIRLSKLDDENLQMELEDIELLALTKEIKNTLNLSAQQKNIQFMIHGEECVILGMRQIIYEMLYNLCDNAIKYNREDGIIEVDIMQDEKQTVWEIKDTGIGIASEDKDRIFERFYRVDKSHSRATGGTGLGLSIVKHGAALHNAKVELESSVGEGTTIRICFHTKME